MHEFLKHYFYIDKMPSPQAFARSYRIAALFALALACGTVPQMYQHQAALGNGFVRCVLEVAFGLGICLFAAVLYWAIAMLFIYGPLQIIRKACVAAYRYFTQR